MRVEHTLKPIYDANSQILILGSLPSVKSREVGFYYGHPRNRFWKVMEILFEEVIEDREQFCFKHHLALYDVIESCDIKGSSDAHIKDVKVTNLAPILENSQIHTIVCTGKKAYDLYQKYQYPKTKIPAILLPSTSPANAGIKLEALVEAYEVIKRRMK